MYKMKKETFPQFVVFIAVYAKVDVPEIIQCFGGNERCCGVFYPILAQLNNLKWHSFALQTMYKRNIYIYIYIYKCINCSACGTL